VSLQALAGAIKAGASSMASISAHADLILAGLAIIILATVFVIIQSRPS
jgi:hypothetical protein